MIGERYEYIIYMKNVAENVNFSLEELSSQNNSSRRTSRYRCEGIVFHKNTKKLHILSYRTKKYIRTTPFWMTRSSKGMFHENIIDRPISGRLRKKIGPKVQKPTIQKFKNVKNSTIFKIWSRGPKIMRNGAKHFLSTQTFHFWPHETPEIRTSTKELILKIWKFAIFHILSAKCKVIPRVVLSKNSYLKVIPLKSSGNLDAFCTINEYAETYRSKYTFYSSQLILLENYIVRIIFKKTILFHMFRTFVTQFVTPNCLINIDF